MNIDEELYYLALNAEDEYLGRINRYLRSNFTDLKVALDFISKEGFSDNIKDYKSQYEDGITIEVAQELLREIEKNPNKIINAEGLFKTKHAQVKSASDAVTRAGFVDEVNTIKIFDNAMHRIAAKYNNSDDKFILEYDIESTDTKGQDFQIKLHHLEYSNQTRYLGNTAYTSGFYKSISDGVLPMENKLNLNKFHITNGTGRNLLNNGGTEMIMRYIENAINQSVKEQASIRELRVKELYGAMATDDEIAADDGVYNFYINNINGNDYKQLLANIILYNKLKNNFPIFVTTNKGYLQFKLCSEVISDIAHGKWTLNMNTLNKTYVANLNRNKTTYEVAKKINNKILSNIGKYQLWYGK